MRYILLLSIAAIMAVRGALARKKLIYIYEFPKELTHTWPSRDIVLDPKTTVWKHYFNENEGFGHIYEGNVTYMETWQYASFRIIMSRLMRSKYRTRNISEASMFLIPYDSGTECYVDEKGNFRFRGNPLGHVALTLLQSIPTVRRHDGYDHFLIHGSSLGAHDVSVKLDDVFQYLANASILTVEKMPRVHRFIRNLEFIQPIPMVSMYHWRKTEGRASIPALRTRRKRRIYISYFGSSRTTVPESNRLRVRLFKQCEEANTREADSVVGKNFEKICLSNLFGEGTNRDSLNVDQIMQAYERSVFCLCPPGDTPIRRALFDALMTGCIPVIFRNQATWNPIIQYDWHLTEVEIAKAFAFLDSSNKTLALRDFIAILIENYDEERIKEKQKAIVDIVRKLQYSMPPDVWPFEFPSPSDELPMWDPPFEDAVDVIVDNFFKKVEKYIPLD